MLPPAWILYYKKSWHKGSIDIVWRFQSLKKEVFHWLPASIFFAIFFAIPKIINTFAALIFKGKGVGLDRVARSNNIIPNANIEVLLFTVNILVV